MKKIHISADWLLIAGFALFKFLIHLFTSTNYGLQRDAYLYLAQGHHLDFGFASVPPFTALAGRFITLLAGDSPMAVRLLPALAGAASIVVIGLIVKRLGGRNWAVILACGAFLFSPSFLRSNSLFQPVSFNQFFWLLSGYFIIRLIQSRNPVYWLHLFILWGAAFLNKYSIAFLAAGFLISLLFTRERRLFISRHFLLGPLLGFLMVLPNLLWQFSHNWPVITHLTELQRTQLVHVSIPNFLLMQVIMNLPGILVWSAGLFFFLFSGGGRRYRVVGYTVLATFLILILLRGKFYYTLGLYPVLFAGGGYFIEKHSAERLHFLKPAILLFMAFISVPGLPYALPVLKYDALANYAAGSIKAGFSEPMIWEDGRVHSLPQDYADMIGWKELGDIVTRTYLGLNGQERAGCVIYTENYGEAGAVRYFGEKRGLPEPISFNDSFLLWAPDSLNRQFSTLIYVNDDTSDVSHYFGQVRMVGQITNVYSREHGLPVFLCRYPRNNFAKFYREKAAELKSVYRR